VSKHITARGRSTAPQKAARLRAACIGYCSGLAPEGSVLFLVEQCEPCGDEWTVYLFADEPRTLKVRTRTLRTQGMLRRAILDAGGPDVARLPEREWVRELQLAVDIVHGRRA
jgi:hypothetical protein